MSILFLGILILAYFFIRQIPFDKDLVAAFAVIGASIVSLLAIMQYVNADFGNIISALGLDYDSHTFVSTMSNRDLGGFYFGIMYPFSFYLSTRAERLKKIVGYIGVVIITLGTIVCDTDAAILCFGLELVLIALVSAGDNALLRPFIINIFAIGIAFAALGWVTNHVENTGEMAFIPALFLNFYMALAFIAIGLVLLLLMHFKRPGIIRMLAVCALALICLYPVYIMLYTHFRPRISGEADLPFDTFLLFSKSWGSGRGFIWRVSLAVFGEEGLFDKLFGLGAQGYALAYINYIERNPYAGYTLRYYDAHNMYIHYMIEYGIVGLISAVSLFVYRIKAMMATADYFFRIKAVALIAAMVSAIFLFFNNINMAFIPCIL